MDHGLMQGMIIGGILLSAFPIALGVALAVAGLRLYREQRAADAAGGAPYGSGGPPAGRSAPSSWRKRLRLRR